LLGIAGLEFDESVGKSAMPVAIFSRALTPFVYILNTKISNSIAYSTQSKFLGKNSSIVSFTTCALDSESNHSI